MPVRPMDTLRALDWNEPISVDAHTPLRVLAEVLTNCRVGAVIVRSEEIAASIVSERDVTAAIAAGADPDEVWAADVVSRDLITASPDDRIVDVAQKLLDEGIRHVAVAADREIVGVLSMRDLFAVLVDSALRTAVVERP